MFRSEWDNALETEIGRLEKAIYERATDGVPRGIWMKNEHGVPVKVDEVRDYSDTLAMFTEKARPALPGHGAERGRAIVRHQRELGKTAGAAPVTA